MGAVSANLRVLMMFSLLTVIFVAVGWAVGTYFMGNWITGRWCSGDSRSRLRVVLLLQDRPGVLPARVVNGPRPRGCTASSGRWQAWPACPCRRCHRSVNEPQRLRHRPADPYRGGHRGHHAAAQRCELTGVLARDGPCEEPGHVGDDRRGHSGRGSVLRRRSFLWGSMFGGEPRQRELHIKIIVA